MAIKNLTVSLDDEDHRLSRIRAARAGLSMSRYVAELVRKDVHRDDGDEEAQRAARLKALEQFLSAPKLSISENGRMPTAEERNARR